MSGVIPGLALKRLSSHRLRTAVTAFAVVLTSVLYMTVLSIAWCIADSVQLSRQLATGSDFHAQLPHSGFALTPTELLRRVRSSPDVDEANILSFSVNFSSEFDTDAKSAREILLADRESVMKHLFLKKTKGRFPSAPDEIMLCEETYPGLSVGDRIGFRFMTGEAAGGRELELEVCGFFVSDADFDLNGVMRWDETLDGELFSGADIMISFHSSIDIEGQLDELEESLSQYLEPGGKASGTVNYAFLGADIRSFFTAGNIALIIMITAVLFFASFLLIYNIYSIALTQDMRTMGLLGVIGMTFRQMRALITLEGLMISAAAIPLGLIAGYFIGFRALTPVFMSMSGEELPYRFNSLIAVISGGLTLFTLLFSATRPIRRIKKLTPVQSVSERPLPTKRERQRGSMNSPSPLKLAAASISRSKGRTAVTALSAALSVLLFTVVGAISGGVREYILRDMGMFDFETRLECEVEKIYADGMRVTDISRADFNGVISRQIIDEIEKLDPLSEIYEIRSANVTAKGSSRLSETIRAYRDQSSYKLSDPLIEAMEGSISAVVVGVPDELCRYIKVGEDERGEPVYYDGSELYDGRHVLSVGGSISQYSGSSGFNGVHLYDGDLLSSDSMKRDYEVIYCEVYGSAALRRLCVLTPDLYEAMFILPMSVFSEEFPNAETVTLLMNAKEGREKELESEVEKIVDGYVWFVEPKNNYEIRLRGRIDEMRELDERLTAINLTGGVLCGIILLIGVMNMVNSSLTSVIHRRREYAMLEAVGMTEKQLRLMIIFENAVGAIAALIALTLGSVLSRAVVSASFGIDAGGLSLSAVIALAVMITVSAAVSLVSFYIISELPVTQRLREE